MYPKPEYCHGDLYKMSSIGSGYTEKSYALTSKNQKNLYYSDNYSISPQELLAQIFDSVDIMVKLDTTITIKFNAKSLQHYTQNIFSSSSIWTLHCYDESRATSGSKQIIHVRSFEYSVIKDSIK